MTNEDESLVGQVEKSPIDVSREKIDGLKTSFESARPKLRELLGIKEGEPETFFIGVYGSCARGSAIPESDVDGYLFYQRGDSTPDFQGNPYLDYDLSQCFDSPAKTLFGHPQGRKPPNPNGKEDVEVHDITKLNDQITNTEPLEAGIVKNRLREIAILFSPGMIGDTNVVEQVRLKVKESMNKRQGKPFDQEKFQRLWDSGYGPVRGLERSHIQQFENSQADGSTTWHMVQEEHQQLFGKPLEDLE